MNILLIGSGGREHALAEAIAKSPRVTSLFAAPGNPGIGAHGRLCNIDITDHSAIIALCRAEQISLVVVGPEGPLVAGLTDDLATAGIAAFGPKAQAARLEGSKAFTKSICDEMGIPTASYAMFDNPEAALAYAQSCRGPMVIKADGLAAGKGVVVAATLEAALGAIRAHFEAKDNPGPLLIEEFLEGPEVSVFALCDGSHAVLFGSAGDYKRAFDGDTGPNTGGMGAYSPSPHMTAELSARIKREIIDPTLVAMARRGAPFTGVLYAGLMLCGSGPKLIEYNVRFGDPECQVLLARLKTDLVDLMIRAVEGNLENCPVEWHEKAALTVVMATRGYPGAYGRGTPVGGITEAVAAGAMVHQAGTALINGRLVANGGRVLNVGATGKTIAAARQRAYAGVAQIDWPDGFYRTDIGAGA
jgi:phosphoribosylamine---glycine ligase